jgi:hypothetical protein
MNLPRLALAGALLLCVIGTALLPAIPQPQGYHAFADARQLFGIANFWNVVSNVPIGIAGLAGLIVVVRQPALFLEPGENLAYACFFGATLLAAVGSTYYHLVPNDARLLWDRLPIGLATTVLPIAVAADHFGARSARPLILPALLAGAVAAVYWRMSELAGHGNVVPYLMLQLLAIVAVLILARRPGRYSRGRDLWVVIGLYGLARLTEVFDAAIYRAGGLLSGHTIKHLLAALAAAWVLRMIRLRVPVTPMQAAST